MQRYSRCSGFTLIELLVVVVIIGILAAIALPNFIGAQKKAKISQVKGNMHTCQLASESDATDTAGVYSTTVTGGIDAYYPSGGNTPGGRAGNFPVNPFNASNSTPVNQSPITSSIAQLRAIQVVSSAATPVNAGLVVYGSTSDLTSYAVEGFDDAGQIVAGNAGYALVLSNQ